MSESVLITAAELRALLDAGEHAVILDVRFLPGKPSLRGEYEEAHIPGAHFVELPEQLQGPGGGAEGARPLPDASALQRELVRWGVHPGSTVVVYSNGTAGAAARAWFVLASVGVTVRYLDGGLAAWRESGGAVSTAAASEGGGTFAPESAGLLPTATAAEIAALVENGVPVLDARKAEAFAGDGSARSGHIPGAISAPAAALLDPSGRLRDREELLALFAGHGIEPGDTVGVYCGGGVAAALGSLALREIGAHPQLFVGSFSAWAADPDRPVARLGA